MVAQVSAQSFNHEIVAEGKAPLLLGKINKDGLSSEGYSEWFLKNHEDYKANTEVIQQFEEALKEYTITAFMGTWCGDSKREVPRFYNILEAAQFPLDRLTLIAVSGNRNNYKQSPGGEEEGLSIHRVPTFIFYKNGQEINRIVESPVETFEADIAAIVKGTYTPNYQAVALLSELLKKVPPQKFETKAVKLLPKLKATVTKLSELNTYSNVLFASGKQEEAIAIALLNTKLFPAESRAYVSLANKLRSTSRFSEAQKYYEKALALDPDNELLQKSISFLKLGITN
jgi:tetratricopeptide (TPR) repeat protein